MKNLKVYKASAGSGKTFTLTVEYIRLLLINPDNYSRILAVTFTNKATNEMKDRILHTLDKIAKRNPDAEGYLKNIRSSLQLSDEQITERAQIALRNILHDYSRFRIETIDSFFQSIIRNLAHELSLTANLKVDLNQNEVLSDAVREIIENLQSSSNLLITAIKEFIEDKIENSKNWKINDDIEKFGKNIFNEVFRNKGAEFDSIMHNEHFFPNYQKTITALKKEKIQEITHQADQFFDLCKTNGFSSDDFYRKSSGLYGYFTNLSKGNYKEPNSYVMENLNGTKDISKDTGVMLFENDILRLLQTTVQLVDANNKIINTVDLISRHLNQMRLLGAVNAKVRELNSKANRFLLVDTARFLNEMIGESDIPFIYEKSGARFDHIMIDEFQDTSSLQWENFKPLLKNSIDAGKMCLIVGDVKQSIYRWRNTNWEILNHIESDPDFAETTEIHTLDTNHRSAETVINFNNQFFRNAINSITAGDQTDNTAIAYSDVEQKISDRHKGQGYVRIEVIPQDHYTADTLQRLPAIIDELLSKGIQQKDICLLLRTNKQINKISAYFEKERPDLRIVSNEAYLLSSSLAINIIILALKYIVHPTDRLTLATLVYAIGTPSPFMMTLEQLQQHLPKAFKDTIDELAVTPLYTLCHQIYNHFSLHTIPNQDPYLMCFFDHLNEYIGNESIDITHFLNYWDDKLKDVNIPAESINGIRAMTIHKSKGLEFHTVICPFCSWRYTSGNENLLWCEPSEHPFSELPLTAVTYQTMTAQSLFSKDYESESAKILVDNLNLLYVAFTRAEQNLIILTGNETNQGSVWQIIGHSQMLSPDQTTAEFGTLTPIEPLESLESLEPLEPLEPHPTSFKPSQFSPIFRQSNKSTHFIGTLADNENEEDKFRYINEGLIIHRYLELIHSRDDSDKAILQLEEEGYFENEQYKSTTLQLINKVLTNQHFDTWFDSHWTIFNECTLIAHDSQGNHIEKRPDRVITDGHKTIVIDYKTGTYSTDHIEQVRTYMQLLQHMGHNNVEGYLWYIRRNEIIPVK